MGRRTKNRKSGQVDSKTKIGSIESPAEVNVATESKPDVPPTAPASEEAVFLPPAVEQWLRRNGAAIGIALFLVAATLAVYGQTIGFDFVSYDDDQYVYENYYVRQGLTFASLKWAFSGVHAANWHPLTTLSHFLDWRLYGKWAGGHHLTNVLLHAASSVVLFLALRRLTGAIWLSGLVAVLFCLHPLHVESVAWVSERKDVLSGLFFGLTLWAYAAYAQDRAGSGEDGAGSGEPGAGRTEQGAWSRFPRGRYLLVVVLFALGLLCKPMLVTLPFVLLLLDFWPLARWRSAWPPAALILEKLPLMLLSLASCVVTYEVQSSSGAVAETASLLVRVQTVALGYARYLGMLVWPFQLAAPYPRDREIYPAATLIIGLALVAFSALALIYGRRQRGYLLVGWFWFLGMLIPVSGLVIIGDQSVADRYSYLTFTGIFIALVWGAADILGARKDCGKTGSLAASEEALTSSAASGSSTACHGAANSRTARFAYTKGKSSIAEICGWTVAGVVIVFYAVRSFQQARIWRSSDVLYQHTLAVTTNNAVAHTNYGVILSSQGKLADAEWHFHEALRIKPRDKLAYNDLGLLEFERKNYPAAKTYLKTALEIEPTSGLVRSNLAGVYCESGDAKAAEQLCLEAIAIDPTLSKAESNLGTALASQGRYGDAIPHYQRALELDPDNLGCRVNMAISLFAQGSADQAIVELETALQLDPESVRCHHELAKIYNSLRRLSEAESQWKIVLSLDPTHAAAAKGLGMVLVKTGRGSDAIGALQVALAAEPRDLETRRYLAFAFMAAKQLKTGIEGFREILREDPRNAIAMNSLAWIYATAPDKELRSRKAAVELAEKSAAIKGQPLPNVLDTLAAAYAEAGRFKEAVDTAKKARQAAEKTKDQALVDGIDARLKLYEAGKPYRDQSMSN